jgi:hypothetical protein
MISTEALTSRPLTHTVAFLLLNFSLWIYAMNRCLLRHLPQLKATLLVLAAAVTLHLPAPAAAQVARRLPPIPPTAQSGVLVVTVPPEVLLDGKYARLSPGARIHGYDNMLVMSASIVGRQFPVRYLLEPLGMVHEVWILTAAEVAALPKGKP